MSAARGQQSLRRIAAVFAGLVTVVVLSIATDAVMHATGIFPPFGQSMSDSLFILATAYRTVYGVVGGYVAARLAPDHRVRHAVALGAVGFFISLAGAIATWNAAPELGPRWYPIALVVIAIPSSWSGGMIVNRTRQAGGGS